MESHNSNPRLFRLVRNVEGSNFFPFLLDNPIEAAPYFARGFHDAADALVEIYATGGYPDYVAPPVVFLYRHAAELYLKGVIWMGDDLLKVLKRPTSNTGGIDFSSHQLSVLLPFAEFVINSFGLIWNENERGSYADGVSLLAELERVDPNSFTFRYPITKSRQPTKEPEFGFNLYAFAEPLSNVLEGWFEIALHMEDVREHHSML
jgi:hypothetical protein